MQAGGVKPSGAIKGRVKRDPGAAGKIGQGRSAASKATKTRKKGISPEKVARISGRVNDVTNAARNKSGVKSLNAVEVGVRAKAFLTRKAGGMSGMVGKNFAEQQAIVRSGLTSRPRYSTQKPNRNKPLRFNALGQDKARAAAKAANVTAREKIAATTAKQQSRTGSPSRNRLLGRRELIGSRLGAGNAPVTTRAARIGSVVKRPSAAKQPSLVVRTRKQSKTAQRGRREAILSRTRTGSLGMGVMRKNPRIKKQQTGMSQLSLMGKAKPLVRFRPVKR
jgi:hypothetical protein